MCNLIADDPQQSDMVKDFALDTENGEDAELSGFVVSWPSLPQYNNSCGK